ncbi:MAG: HNH endonuclease [Opitutales bacterium]
MSEGDSGRQVLVLNRLWQPVNIVGPRRAFSLLSQENAQVINTADGSFQTMDLGSWIQFSIDHPPVPGQPCVKTVRYALRLPAVVILRFFDRVPKQDAKFSRRTVLERDDYTCQYCGRHYSEHELTLDHVIPRDQGGRTTWENIVACCIYCNSEKANRMPHQAGMTLRTKPKRPQVKPFAMQIAERLEVPDWKPFVR